MKKEFELKYGSLTTQWLVIKDLLKEGDLSPETLDLLDEMLIYLGEYTLKGYKEIEDIMIELWKERVWYSIENYFKLPEIDEPIEKSDILF